MLKTAKFILRPVSFISTILEFKCIGSADIVTKNYVKNKNVFSDLSIIICDGRKVIDPNKLYEVDTAEVAVPYGEDEAGINMLACAENE